MRNHSVLSVGLGVLLLSGFFAGLAIAENDSIHVIMTVEDRHYSIGDTITVEVRVYDKGILTDASNITLQMSQHYGNHVALNHTHESTGIYQATYAVTASDNHHTLHFYYDVSIGTDREYVDNQNYALNIDVYSVPDTVDVSFEGQEMVAARPGDTVTATILVRRGDTPIPVTGFDELYVVDHNGNQQDLTYRAQATGIYLADFVVPEVTKNFTYTVYADPIDVGDHDFAMILVNVLDIWAHKLISGTTTSFELYVADLDGQPIEGAWYTIQRHGWPYDEHNGTTDSTGKALIHVSDVNGQESYEGYVTVNGLNQTISGTVINPVTEDPHHNEFDIIWEDSQTTFQSGHDIAINYGAYDSTLPAGSRTIYYYVEAMGTDFAMLSGEYGDHIDGTREVIATGEILTSDLGKFTLEIDAPDTQCVLNVRFEVPLSNADFQNQDYDMDDNFYYEHYGFTYYVYEGDLDGDGDVSIGGGTFSPGEAGTVTVDMTPTLGNQVIAFWGVGDSTLEDMDNYDPEWMSWVPGGNMLMLHMNEDEKLEGTFHVPEFIEDQDVTVAAGYVDSAGVPHFDSKTISPGGLSYTMWIIIIIIIAVVAAIIIAWVKYQYF